MKVLNVQQIRETDAFTILHEPISSINLMERAAKKCFEWIDAYCNENLDTHFHVVAGMGNNGGDGLAISRLLHRKEYSVKTSVLQFSEKGSPDFEHNLSRLKEMEMEVTLVQSEEPLEFESNQIIIDTIFGSGLSRPVDGWIQKQIESINDSNNKIISIDIPSGLFCDDNSQNEGAKIEADYTLTFQCPKLAMMFPENSKFVGEFKILNIQLDQNYIDSCSSNYTYVDGGMARNILKPKDKFTHKGNNGRALLVTGSKGKMGAAILASRAALRSGIGLLTAKVPACGLHDIQTAVPECMAISDNNEEFNTEIIAHETYNSIGIGPGLGQDSSSLKMFEDLYLNYKGPMVIDADAINLLSKHRDWLDQRLGATIFTPHVGEFKRLVGDFSSSEARMDLQSAFCKKYGCYLILKGAHTSLCTPDGQFYFNSTGNPGMATGGSGDVLTGILTALLAQGYNALDACVLGVYLHGLAGDFAQNDKGIEGLLAGDIVECLPKTFQHLH